MLPIFRHALSHGAVSQLAKKALKVLIEFFEAIDVATFLKRFSVDCFGLGKNFLPNDCLCFADLLNGMILEYWFELWVLFGQFSHFFLGLPRLSNAEDHMEHFFVEGTCALEGRPHFELQGSLIFIFGINLGQIYELFDESYEVLLEVVENRFFSASLESFID